MALVLVGLGLWEARDITVRGLEAARAADRVAAEFYTARLMGSTHAELEALLGRSVEVLARQDVEQGGLVADATARDVVLLTAGDPLAATTHTDLVVRCRAAGVPVRVIHAPSIHTVAPGLLGLQHYKFGRTVTVARPEGTWFPTSPLEHLLENRARGLHTLVLLDIQAHRDHYMSAADGIRLLLEMADRLGTDAFGPDTPVGVVARAGSDAPFLRTGTAGSLATVDAGPPLHCLVVPGRLHDVEAEAWASLA